MIFLAISDNSGAGVRAISATSFADAQNQIQQLYGSAGDGFGSPTLVGVILPDITATITPVQGGTPTVNFTGDSSNQQTIFQAAKNALANNATYLAIPSPTNAQVVSQVQALTRQMDGVIRLLVGDFSATT